MRLTVHDLGHFSGLHLHQEILTELGQVSLWDPLAGLLLAIKKQKADFLVSAFPQLHISPAHLPHQYRHLLGLGAQREPELMDDAHAASRV